MQFAFTEEQELLRREARTCSPTAAGVATSSPSSAFLDRAVLFEEAGRANRGEEFFDPGRPENERLAAVALEAAGIARRALEFGGRAREDTRAVRPADRRLPGGLASARGHVRRVGARALARLLGGVVRRRGRRAGADRGRGGEELRG